MQTKPLSLRTDIAWSDAQGIYIHGHSLVDDLLGKVDFGDIAYLEICGRLPKANESRLFNAMLITCVEHGIVPSTLAARMTYAGAPEALQAAVAAGLLGLGSVFVGSTEGAARLLSDSLRADYSEGSHDVRQLASRIVSDHKERRAVIPGLGHPIHKPADPRTTRLFSIAQETGFHGRYVELVSAISDEATLHFSKPMPVNATGAIGALCCEMGLECRIARAIGVMARAVGLIGHILEDARQPMAVALWKRAEDEATSHFRDAARTTDLRPKIGPENPQSSMDP
jgi:citrate synthase